MRNILGATLHGRRRWLVNALAESWKNGANLRRAFGAHKRFCTRQHFIYQTDDLLAGEAEVHEPAREDVGVRSPSSHETRHSLNDGGNAAISGCSSRFYGLTSGRHLVDEFRDMALRRFIAQE